MNINKLTLTGIDNTTRGWQLSELQDTFPFVEFGVLYSKTNAGSGKYPHLSHIEKEFTPSAKPILNLSAHFCGWYSREVIENHNYGLIQRLHPSFDRVQINYNFSNNDGAKKVQDNLVKLLAWMESYKDRTIILQYNRANKEMLDQVLGFKLPMTLNLLWDDSGGYGKEIAELNTPFKNIYTGYAGGLNMGNIQRVCKQLIDMKDMSSIWVDLESGLRTNEAFDVDKAYNILKMVKDVRRRNNKFTVRLYFTGGNHTHYDVIAMDKMEAGKIAKRCAISDFKCSENDLKIDQTIQYTYNE